MIKNEAVSMSPPEIMLIAAVCPLCGDHEVADFLTAPDRFHWRTARHRLAHCSACSYVWLVDPPKPEEMPYHYDEDYHRTIAAGGETSASNRWMRQRQKILSLKQSGSILDIGCSSGGFLGTMKGSSWKLYGIEMEETTASNARAATGAHVFVGDAMAAPFTACTFDVITCFDVLEHVYQPREFLSKVLDWLKPGGIVYFVLPNIESWEAKIFGTYWYGLELPRHISHFSPRSLRQAMNVLGFKEMVIKTPGTSYIERSVDYVRSGILQRLGFSPTAMANAKQRGVSWRCIRKILRVAVIQPFGRVASLANAGGSIEAVFTKSDLSSQLTIGPMSR